MSGSNVIALVIVKESGYNSVEHSKNEINFLGKDNGGVPMKNVSRNNIESISRRRGFDTIASFYFVRFTLVK